MMQSAIFFRAAGQVFHVIVFAADTLQTFLNVGTGHFFNVFEVGEAISQASDADAQRQLMDASEELTSIRFPGAGK